MPTFSKLKLSFARIQAKIVDFFVTTVLVLIVFNLFRPFFENQTIEVIALLFLMIEFGYEAISYYQWSTTLGKRLFKLEVINLKSGNFYPFSRPLLLLLPFSPAFIFPSWAIIYANVLLYWALFKPDTNWHDLILHQRVVSKEAATTEKTSSSLFLRTWRSSLYIIPLALFSWTLTHWLQTQPFGEVTLATAAPVLDDWKHWRDWAYLYLLGSLVLIATRALLFKSERAHELEKNIRSWATSFILITFSYGLARLAVDLCLLLYFVIKILTRSA